MTIGGVMHRGYAPRIWSLRLSLLAFVAAVALVLPGVAAAAPVAIAQGEVSDATLATTKLAGATVTAYWLDGEWGEYFWVGDATADALGRYTLYDEAAHGPGELRIIARAAGYRSSALTRTWTGTSSLSLAFRLSRAAKIATGTVRRTGGTVLGKATVTALFYDAAAGEYQWAGAGVSNTSGVYTVYDQDVRGPGTYLLKAEGTGYGVQQTGLLTWTGSTALTQDFTLSVLPVIAQGTVRDPARAAVSGAHVEASWIDDADGTLYWVGDAYTASDGTYKVYDSFGFDIGPTYTIYLRASAAGFLTSSYRGSWLSTTPMSHDFALKAPLRLAYGHVRDAVSRTSPVAGALVSVYHFNTTTSQWDWVVDVVTDDGGAFVASDTAGLGAGDYRFTAKAAGYFASSLTATWNGSSALAPYLYLDPVPEIARGTVTVAGTKGTVIPGANVEVWKKAAVGGVDVLVDNTATDENGVFLTLDTGRRGAGTYQFDVSAPGFLPASYTGAWNGSTRLAVSIQMTRVPPIASGRVTTLSTANNIAGASVTARGTDPETGESVVVGTAVTGADGTYSVYDDRGLGAGDYQISFEADDHIGASRGVKWSGSIAVTLDVALAHVAPVASGAVADSVTLLPVVGASVSAARYDSATSQYLWTGETVTGANGAYSVYDTQDRGAGTYQITVSMDGYLTQTTTGTWSVSTALARNFNLVRIVPVAQGVVTGPDGLTPVSGTRIDAARYDGASWIWAGDAYTDAFGAYQLYDEMGLGSGTYRLTFTHNQYVTQIQERVWPGTAAATVNVAFVARPPIVSGTVTDAATRNIVQGALVEAYRYDVTTQEWLMAGSAISDASGRYAIADTNVLGAGQYRFSVEAEGWLPLTSATASWDGVTTLSRDFALTLPPPVATGTVRNSGAAAIVGASVEASWYDPTNGEYVLAGTALSDAAGVYRVFDDVGYGSGNYELFVRKTGYLSQSFVGAWTGTAAFSRDFVLAAVKPIAVGNLTAGGVGRSGVTIEAWRKDPTSGEWTFAGEAVTGVGGAYIVYDDAGLGAGAYELRAALEGYHQLVLSGQWSGSTPLALNAPMKLNAAPTWSVAPPSALIDELKPFSFTATATDPDADVVSYYVLRAPAGVSLNSATGAFTWTPAAGQGGRAYTMTLLARDEYGGEIAQDFTLTVKGAPALQLRAVAPAVRYAGATTLTGTLTNPDGLPLPANTKVVLQYSAYSTRGWTTLRTVYTRADGTFSGATGPTPITTRRYFRAYFAGSAQFTAKYSSPVMVKAYVYLSTPSAATTMYRSRYYTVYSLLKPRHTSGTYPVKLYCYRYESGRWVLRKTFSMKAANYSTYSKVSARVRLPYAGKWRLRAYHAADSLNQATYSSYRYVAVK